MAKSLIVNFGTIACVDNATYYVPIAGAIRTDSAVHGTEANVQIPIRTAGTLRSFRFRVPTNTASVTSVVTVRKNGAGTALTKNVTSDQTGWFEVVADVSVSPGDLLAIEIVVPAETGTNTLTLTLTMLEFEPTDPTLTVQIFACSGDNPSLSTDSTSRFLSATGNTQLSAIEANNKFRIRTSCTFKGLYAFAISNARTTDTVVHCRKNGANGSGTLTFGSGVTGALADAVNEDSFAAGDDFNFSFDTSTGGGAIVFSVFAVEVVSTNNTFPLCIGFPTGISQGAGTTQFYGVAGTFEAPAAAEDDAELVAPFAFTLSEAHVLITANTNAVSEATFKPFVNGSAESLVISVAAGATGLKTEASPTTQAIAVGDTMSLQTVNTDPAGSITRNWFGMLATVPAGGAVPAAQAFYRQKRGN